ncbi:MAG: hypothetical protein ACOYVH_10435 [Spirochaetota bacterium]|jgi:hypothetical protein
MTKRFIAIAGIILFLSMAVQFVSAQEGGTDLDSLFGEEVVVPENPAGQTAQPDQTGQGVSAIAANPLQGLLKTEAVRIGGSITGTIDISGTWNDPLTNGFDIIAPDKQKFSPALSSLVYFDARPEDTFRVHGSFKTAWPFSSTNTFLTSTTDSKSITIPNLSIFELFSDFQLGDKAYFRFGKATVKWGVGYFFSPADIINLEQISLFDPTAQREGPLQFRVLMPFGPSQNTVSFYTIFDTSNPDFSTTALAGKAEFVLGRYELGVSGYYRDDTAERAALTLTGPLGKFDVFAEGVISRGSPKTFYSFSTSAPYYSTSASKDHRTTLYPSATAGFLYNDQNNNITAIAQYYYNGEGYADSERSSSISALNTLLSMPLPDATKTALTGLSKLFAYGSGRHYGAASISFSEIGGSDFSASLLGLANFSDLSGLVQPSVSWQIADRLKLTGSALFFFGASNTEYSILRPNNPMTLSLSLSAGTGNF